MEICRISRKRRVQCLVEKIFYLISMFVTQLCFFCCTSVHNINFREMSLRVNSSGSILNLRNYGDINLDMLGQSEKLVGDSLILKYGDEYGFYAIDYDATEHVYKGYSILSGILAFTPTLFFPGLFGLPYKYMRFNLTANLYIFDSEGNLVRMYDERKEIKRAEGIYYGHDMTYSIARQYSKMFESIFRKANAESEVINTELEKKGVLTEEKKTRAMSKIRAFFTNHRKERSKISNLPI